MPRTLPQFDKRLIGVWSRGLVDASSPAPNAGADDVRILFGPNFSGRYETWFNGLNEVITFNWSPPAADRVTLAGIDYLYRTDGTVKREPCDWHFEAVPYAIADNAAVGDKRILKLHFGQRIDTFALMSETLAGFEKPKF